MDRTTNEQWVPQQGMTVLGSDNEKVGDVDMVEQNYFVVRKGFFFPEDHYIPIDAVQTYDDENVYLNVTKDQAMEQQWSTPPATGEGVAATDTASADELNAVDTTSKADAGDVTDRDSTHIDIHEEELSARRREVDRGDVRVNKDVVTEEREIDVPLTEERVNVSRRDVDRDATSGDHAFEEGTIEVPVHGEEVDVQKRTRVTGEVDIDKTAEQHTERVRDTVRREEVSIEGEEVDRDTEKNRR
jgi:uncharacterized protein (TIGR02271 family)